MLKEVDAAEGKIILFIDEMHLIMAGKGDNGMVRSFISSYSKDTEADFTSIDSKQASSSSHCLPVAS